jgi:hypothetical protein
LTGSSQAEAFGTTPVEHALMSNNYLEARMWRY